MRSGRIVAIVPAFNEAGAIGGVVDAIRDADASYDVVVIDDGSLDRTGAIARAHGAVVVTLPYNMGIGSTVQTGFKYALENGYETAVRLDGDGQHDPGELEKLLGPIVRGEADIVTGSRFVEGSGNYRPPLARRMGIIWFAKIVSVLTNQRVTDTTSGFQALNRKGIALFADDYPNDYPEVEATVLVFKHRLRLVEVPVTMRVRETGTSSITFVRSIYYVLKVTLALCMAMLRKATLPHDEVEVEGT